MDLPCDGMTRSDCLSHPQRLWQVGRRLIAQAHLLILGPYGLPVRLQLGSFLQSHSQESFHNSGVHHR